ncbi:MAG TPA: right-handed parallel beta-helix repeat-containing protein, partial [Thermoanaerobaculia bacterium]|nr:right-handed parallel beta-helix repeat-containing protein [Thermoanaerobaculia bacterium]
MIYKALLRAALAALLLTTAAAHAQTLDQTVSGCNGAAPLRTIQANPSNYRSYIGGLLPGDRLQLAAGTYTTGLNLWNKRGEPGKCIVIEGPASGSPALFTGSDTFNLVSLKDTSYVAVRNLTLDGQSRLGDGVKAEAGAVSVHHILLENLTLRNFNNTVQSVGINAKCPVWNWVIRRNTITATGTGLYLGGSSGQFEVVGFLIENNLIHGTLGYNAELKHQLSRNTAIGVPSSGTTIIRNNVWSKASGSLTGAEARPNLLLGHWPLSGAGSTDFYQVYGNLFDENPYESLFQAEGNVVLHDNLFVNRTGPAAVRFQKHNSLPRKLDIYNNTVVAAGTGITITSADPAYTQKVTANLVFAATPLTGGQTSGNLLGSYATAATALNNPTAPLGAGLDLYPRVGKATGTAVDTSLYSGLVDWNKDWNGLPRINTFRGAYAGEGVNPGWQLVLG